MQIFLHWTCVSYTRCVLVFVFLGPGVKLSERGHVLMSPERCAFSFESVDLFAEDEEDDIFHP